MSRVTRGKITESGLSYRQKAKERELARKRDELSDRLQRAKEKRAVDASLRRRISHEVGPAVKRVYRAAGTIEQKRAKARDLRKSVETLAKGLKDEKNTVSVSVHCKERPVPTEKKAHGSGGGSRDFIPWCNDGKRKHK